MPSGMNAVSEASPLEELEVYVENPFGRLRSDLLFDAAIMVLEIM